VADVRDDVNFVFVVWAYSDFSPFIFGFLLSILYEVPGVTSCFDYLGWCYGSWED